MRPRRAGHRLTAGVPATSGLLDGGSNPRVLYRSRAGLLQTAGRAQDAFSGAFRRHCGQDELPGGDSHTGSGLGIQEHFRHRCAVPGPPGNVVQDDWLYHETSRPIVAARARSQIDLVGNSPATTAALDCGQRTVAADRIASALGDASINQGLDTAECVELWDASDPIRQGDVLMWLQGGDDAWRRCAIVVTADCDIIHRKHAGLLATVPVLRFDEYLAAFVLPPKLRAATDQLRQLVRSRIRSVQGRCRADRPEPMSDGAIDGWIAASDADAILRTLRADHDEDAEQVRRLVRWLRTVPALEDSFDLEAQITSLVEAKRLSGSNKDPASIRLTLARENLDRLRNLPGDALFLHSLAGDQTAGYVVYLRRIDNVAEQAVARRSHEASGRTMLAQRISRLSSPYVFRLTQQLGHVFASIGLPGTYEASREEFIVTRANTLGASP